MRTSQSGELPEVRARYGTLVLSFIGALSMYFRLLLCLPLLITLSGCAMPNDWGGFWKARPLPSLAASYDFSWQLSGDRQVGPLQVFDNGQAIWMQFDVSQPVPAIFARTADGDILLTYRTDNSYVVVTGSWTELLFRGGNLQAFARRVPNGSDPSAQPDIKSSAIPLPDPLAASAATIEQPVLPVDTAMKDQASSDNQSEPVSTVKTVSGEDAAVIAQATFRSLRLEGLPDIEAAPGMLPPASLLVSVPEKHYFRVGPQDGNMRQTLVRWAQHAGWTFQAEHWVVDVDIPIVGEANFDGNFEDAVQQLMASTELADRPLQPCFYANKVLRIVPYAQLCDRTAGREAA